MRLLQAPLDTCLDSRFFACLSVHGLHFTVCAPLITLSWWTFRPRKKIFSAPTPPRTPSDRVCAHPASPSSQTLPPPYFQIDSESKPPFASDYSSLSLPPPQNRRKRKISETSAKLFLVSEITMKMTIVPYPAKSKRGREEGDGTENVINCRDVCRKLS